MASVGVDVPVCFVSGSTKTILLEYCDSNNVGISLTGATVLSAVRRNAGSSEEILDLGQYATIESNGAATPVDSRVRIVIPPEATDAFARTGINGTWDVRVQLAPTDIRVLVNPLSDFEVLARNS